MAHWTHGLTPEDFEKLQRDMKPLRYFPVKPIPIRATEHFLFDGGAPAPLITVRHPQSFADIKWRRPWYKTTPAGLFWRSRASKGVEAVLMREMVERINASADAMLLKVFSCGDTSSGEPSPL